jgi:hypothetical protein
MKTSLYPALAVLTLLGACETELNGPPPPAPVYQTGAGAEFDEHEFGWSRASGAGSIYGVLTYRAGETRYSCRGRDVILSPETPWVRRRMFILYGSTDMAAVPADIVRARTPTGSSGDYASYARKTTCDGDNRFTFHNLPDGGWYVITLARPADGSPGSVAVMRRVVTHGAVRAVVLD